MAISGRVQGPPQDGDIEQYSVANGKWVLTQGANSPSFSGPINLVDNNNVTRGQVDSISGDVWFLSNAIWNPNDGQGGNFYRVDPTHAAFGFQMQGQGFIPGEPNLGYYVAGATIWVSQPESYTLIRGGGSYANPIFNVVGGWELGSTITQQRQMTIGGGGIEIDGYGLIPYGRIVNNDTGTVLHKHLIANVENAYTDLSGYDDPTQESWVWGYVQDFNPASGPPYPPVPNSSRWSVAYIPANTNPTSGIFYEYLKITPGGASATVEVTAQPTTPLGVATKNYVDTKVLATTIGPATATTVSATTTTIISATATLVSGRRYRISAQGGGQQITAAGSVTVYLNDSLGLITAGFVRVIQASSVPASVQVTGCAVWYVVATANGPDTFTQQAWTTAGSFTVPANQMQLTVEDVGV